ncbi:MAG: hypothetical protein ABFS10_13350 [Bacteroidota bacterium]
MSINRREAIKRVALAGMLTATGPIGNLMANAPAKGKKGYFKYSLKKGYPEFDYFSVDSLGKNKLSNNPLKLDELRDESLFTSEIDKKSAKYFLKDSPVSAWEFERTEKGFVLRSNYVENNVPWTLHFNQSKNHVTMLGIVHEENKIDLPGVLHLPDMGSFRVRSEQVKTIDYSGKRLTADAAHAKKYVKLSFPPATKTDRFVEYTFEIAAIYPEVTGIENDPRFDGYRRNYINTFQVNPHLQVLANNTTSDSCTFVQYGYSELAVAAPDLVDDLRAIDLVKMTVDRYLAGQKGYGHFGYRGDIDVFPNVRWGGQSASLDAYPSLLIAACNYYKGSEDKAWLTEKYNGLVSWAEEIMSRDKDHDGLMEYGFSGNSNSYSGETNMRPSNWWDTIGFGHKDAYANAMAYSAIKRFIKLCELKGDEYSVKRYTRFAGKIRENYYDTFFNPKTGVLAGWKSEDGELHDYYFTFVNGMAISYGLVTKEQGNRIMDAMLAKMKDVGYSNFEKGLPGNLINIPKKDYAHFDPRWGGNPTDDSTAGWQHYENGGVSGNYVYFTIKALYSLGRKRDAEMIMFPLLKAIENGAFQGECDNGMTKDWQTWDGECWGYEGFLVDNYWGLLAVAELYKH